MSIYTIISKVLTFSISLFLLLFIIMINDSEIDVFLIGMIITAFLIGMIITAFIFLTIQLDEQRQATPAGQAIGEKGYILDMVKRFRNISITNNTDWQNLLKALHYWEKNSTKLYLSVQNEWASNLALTGTYATPTTLVQFTGKLQNFRDLVYPNEVVVNVEMVYINA